MNILVANLDSNTTAADLISIFNVYGTVKDAEIAMDGFTGQARGFAFVEMDEEEQARAAIAGLHLTDVHGRKIEVREAPERNQHKGSYKVGDGPVNLYRFKKN